MKVKQKLFIENHVHLKKQDRPITGVHSPDHDLTGWVTDKSFILSNSSAFSRYDTKVGGQRYNILEGTFKSDWNSVVSRGIKFDYLESFKYLNSLTWTPVFSTGSFSIYWNVLNLFSSFHYSSILKRVGDHFEIDLRDDCIVSSIECAIWTRDDFYVKHPYYRVAYRNQFSKNIAYKGPFSLKGTWNNLNGYYYPLYLDKQLALSKSELDVDNSGERVRKYKFDEYPDVIFYSTDTDINKAQATNNETYPFYPNEGLETLERKNEFIIEDGKIKTSKLLEVKAGVKESDIESVRSYWENKSQSNPNGRFVFTKYFPIEENTLEVIAMSSADKIINLNEVKNLDYEDDSECIYQVDYDLGIIRVGGFQRIELSLLEDISEKDTEILVTNKFDLKSYPESGIFKIGSELIYYSNKTTNGFFNCRRGFKNTKAESYKASTNLQHIKNGKSINSNYTIYCKYNAVPKIRYEVSDIKKRYANKYGFLNVKPIDNLRENGIIQISTVDKNVGSLKLDVDANLIFGSMYGPIFYGTDYRRVIATAFDRLGNPVDDIEITIKIVSGPGFLNYSLREYTGISNNEGEIYSLYGVPYDWESIAKKVFSVTHSANTTRMVVEPIPSGLIPEKIQVYQILKHDPVLGTLGKKVSGYTGLLTYGHNMDPSFNKTAVDLTFVQRDSTSSFEFGSCYIVVSDGNTQIKLGPKRIIQTIDLIDEDTNSNTFGTPIGTRIILEESIPQAYANYTVRHAELFEGPWDNPINEGDFRSSGPVRFNSEDVNGCRRVLYEWRDDIEHPLSGDMGAYYPVRPDTVTNELLVFNKLLPLPDPENIDSNLGGYLVVSSDVAEFVAECVDPISGNIIRSNKVKIRIDIPAYLNGVSYRTGLPIPYGFKLVTEDFNDCSGIGGANFLSINPLDYNILDLMLEIE